MKTYQYRNLTEPQLEKLCERPRMDNTEAFAKVRPILEAVRQRGDEAVLSYTRQFDGTAPDPQVLDPRRIEVTLDPDTRKAIDTALENIQRFHKAQLPIPLEVETMPGVRCRRLSRPIERAGLYVPGGTAILPSTLLMLGVPAALAGVDQIVVATPPDEEGGVADELIYICRQLGVGTLLLAGGAQAVAAMAYGTETVPSVDKIFGPGNQYVTAAKMLLLNSDARIAIDMPAGPSEVLVVADHSADPAFVAADLLAQAEHGPDSQVVLVATAGFDRAACSEAIESQLEDLPRKEVAGNALEHSFLLQVDTLDEAMDFSNRYAPEHLMIQTEDPEGLLDSVRHAGSVFLGRWSPESAGDYASGTNHTLPTYGYARMYSGVSVDSFMKFVTVQQLSEEGLKTIAPTVNRLAELEELEAHKRAVTIRLDKLNL